MNWKIAAVLVLALGCARASAQPCDSWAQVSSGGDAPSGYTYGWAFDSVRDRVVAVSSAPGCASDLIRVFDGTTWILKNPAVSLPPLGDFSMVFDSARGRCVLVGGVLCNTTICVDGHWEWDGTNWEAKDIPRPSARRLGAMAFDADRGRTVLFGGEGPSGLLNDLWEFDGTSWTEIPTTSGPSPRYAMGVAFDAVGHRTVLFGGRTSSAVPGGTWYNETWTWDGSAWSLLPGIDDPQLPLNYLMAPDPVTGRLIMYAFYNGDVRCYAFEGGAWTRLTIGVPSFRAWCGYVADTATQKIVLFGGLQDTSMWQFTALPRPTFDAQPQPQSMRLGSTLHLSASLSGEPNPTLRWYRNGSPISNGGRITGATAAALSIQSTEPGDSGLYFLRAAGSSCVSESAKVQVNVWCFADLDGGQDTGVPDGAVDINDLLYFLVQFEGGSANADLDNGSGTGTSDGGVDINDLLFFLAHFEAGC